MKKLPYLNGRKGQTLFLLFVIECLHTNIILNQVGISIIKELKASFVIFLVGRVTFEQTGSLFPCVQYKDDDV